MNAVEIVNVEQDGPDGILVNSQTERSPAMSRKS